MTEDDGELRVGERIEGKIEILRRLGSGGMGSVYEAKNLGTGRHVAVKVLLGTRISDSDSWERFRQEAHAGGRVRHANVVDIYDAGVHGEVPYIVMELLRGESLAAFVDRDGPLPVSDVVRLGVEAASGLAAAHRAGIVHRDVKPENLFLAAAEGGEPPITKVVDFGISKLTSGESLSTTRTGSVVGTPIYMSPEQARGEKDVDARADVYGLAAALYTAVTGRPPFVADNYNALIAKILTEEPPPPSALRPELPAALDAVLARALSRDRDWRSTLGELTAGLREAMSTVADPLARTVASTSAAGRAPAAIAVRTPAPPGVSGPLPRGAGRRAVAIGAAVLVVVGSALVVGIAVSASHGPERASSDDATAGAHESSMPIFADSMPGAPAGHHRLAVLATCDPGAIVDGARAWTLATRIVEEVDHYADFRPVSSAGVLNARIQMLGDAASVPDELGAIDIAQHLQADTVASLAIGQDGDELSIAVHVFATSDPSTGASLPREHLSVADLDAGGPARLGEAIAHALARHWGIAALEDELDATVSERDVPFEAHEHYLEAVQFCALGRYQECEERTRQVLAADPEFAAAYGNLACALSFGGKNDEAFEAVRQGNALLDRAPSRRDRTVIEQDRLFVEATEARTSGDAARMRRVAREIIRLNLVLAEEYLEPIAYLYAATAYQWFLGDVPTARRMFARARTLGPSLYPGFSEEARLLLDDPRTRPDAARLIYTFIECNPSSPMLDLARADAREWGLERPASSGPCRR